jgi:hypothetical protein
MIMIYFIYYFAIMQKNKILAGATKAFAAGVITLASLSPVFAVVAGPSNAPGGSTNAQATSAADRQQTRSQLCTATQTAVNNRIQAQEQVMNAFTERYNNFDQKLGDLINAISIKYPTIDLAKLIQDREQLQAMHQTAVQASVAAYNAYGLMNFDNCLNGTGEFRSELNQARTQAQTATQEHANYWEFIQNTIKADLESIRTQIENLVVVE